mmetsp:Transcript_76265/g.171031  ORF Transcript_76265/g.171031 Transcript_76265/m.171031 type:complete len:204 (+) Transcript_76265:1257-1868(+)
MKSPIPLAFSKPCWILTSCSPRWPKRKDCSTALPADEPDAKLGCLCALGVLAVGVGVPSTEGLASASGAGLASWKRKSTTGLQYVRRCRCNAASAAPRPAKSDAAPGQIASTAWRCQAAAARAIFDEEADGASLEDGFAASGTTLGPSASLGWRSPSSSSTSSSSQDDGNLRSGAGTQQQAKNAIAGSAHQRRPLHGRNAPFP